MHPLKAALLSYVLPVLATAAVAAGVSYAQGKNTVCTHEYALCTSALCVPTPGNAKTATCFCEVQSGKSMTSVPCKDTSPRTDANGIKTVYSQFSMNQFAVGKKGMKCASGTPWTWCLNKVCTVDPTNPKKAICTCDVLRTGAWMTLGGECHTESCKTGYWSGASMKDFDSGSQFLTKALALKESPVKWCPGAP